MAQLRDAQTSAFIAEGTPLQMATLASKVGFDEVIFDDVGVDFDPQAVLTAHEERLGLASGDDKAGVADMAKLERGAIKDANTAISEARAAVENAE